MVSHKSEKPIVSSFAAASTAGIHTLILGTMPGVASLTEQQYYAHPRNAFWPIMLNLCVGTELSYELEKPAYKERLQILNAHGYALWDVLARCERKGSLDSSIRNDTVVANDLDTFAMKHSALRTIAFNGKTAQNLFFKHISRPPHTDAQFMARLHLVCLPSTSPAMAMLNLQQKASTWKAALLPD